MRFFQYGELPLVLLALLSRSEMTGYDLMAELDRLFAPRYTSSAGSVYPALNALESEGLIEPIDPDDPDVPKRYRVTTEGRAALERRGDKLAAFEVRTGVFLRPDGEVEAEVERLQSMIAAVRGRVEPEALTGVVKLAQQMVRELEEKERE